MGLGSKNFGCLDQRAAKLLAVKVRVLKKKSATSAIPVEVCASADLNCLAFKDLIPFQRLSKVQEASIF